MMMKSAEDRRSGDLADSLDRPVTRRIPIQGQMRSEFGAIPGVDGMDLTLSCDDLTAALAAIEIPCKPLSVSLMSCAKMLM